MFLKLTAVAAKPHLQVNQVWSAVAVYFRQQRERSGDRRILLKLNITIYAISALAALEAVHTIVINKNPLCRADPSAGARVDWKFHCRPA